MSGGTACKCKEREEPLYLKAGSNRPTRLWRVRQRRCNHSAFNGYHYTPSKWSSVTCLRCGALWRTTADYVDALFDVREGEDFISPGYTNYPTAMELWGRTPYERGEAI